MTRAGRMFIAATIAVAGAWAGGAVAAQDAQAERPQGTVQILIDAELARPARPNACLHGADEAGAEARRRTGALRYVESLNAAQAAFFDRTAGYAQFSELAGLGGVPAGFVLQHAAAGNSYLFSLKDQQDPCGYTLYSDHAGVTYEAAPLPAGARVP